MLRKKVSFKKGYGEAIEYTFAFVFVVAFLLLFLGFALQFRAEQHLDHAVTLIAREVAVCESLEEAQELAEKLLPKAINDTKIVSIETAEVVVKVYNGKDWEKGNFAQVWISVYMDTYDPFTSGTKRVQTLVMIENSEGGINDV